MPQRYGDHQKNPASLIETMVNIMTNTTKALIIDLISLLLSALTLSFSSDHPQLKGLLDLDIIDAKKQMIRPAFIGCCGSLRF
jgi:hypothetical protein